MVVVEAASAEAEPAVDLVVAFHAVADILVRQDLVVADIVAVFLGGLPE